MKENLIGMFDSGLGGLSVWRALVASVPDVPALFVADQQLCPYGNLTEEAIFGRSIAICDWLVSQEVTQIVVACNTATSVAIERLRQRYPIPVIGIETGSRTDPLRENSHPGNCRNAENRKISSVERSLRQDG
ncbi:TPA: glutamate racemase [Klebsiella quasipneumoniae subsp. quasipneumoniae]